SYLGVLFELSIYLLYLGVLDRSHDPSPLRLTNGPTWPKSLGSLACGEETKLISYVTINTRNQDISFISAVDRHTAEKLVEHFQRIDNDDRFKVAILYGGTDVFCSGADLKAMTSPDSRNRLSEDGDAPMGLSRMLLKKPVIAAISGYCVAGGLELACWCDMRVAEEDAVFGVFCRRFGVPLIDGGTIRLPRLIGISRALDLILTGRAVDTKEAHEIGLVNRIAPKGKVLEHAIDLAKLIASFPQMCMRSDRISAYQQWDLPFDEAIRNEFRLGNESLKTEGLNGANLFKSGVGKHGSFTLPQSKL
ncbi:Putative enoyl CoA-hydratase, partial [Heterostelium album PN500]